MVGQKILQAGKCCVPPGYDADRARGKATKGKFGGILAGSLG